MDTNIFWDDANEEPPASQNTTREIALALEAQRRIVKPGVLLYGQSTPRTQRRLADSLLGSPESRPLEGPQFLKAYNDGGFRISFVTPEAFLEPSSSSGALRPRTKPKKAPSFRPREIAPAEPGNPLEQTLAFVSPQVQANEEKKRRHEQKAKNALQASTSTIARLSSDGQQVARSDKDKGKQHAVNMSRSKSETRIDLTSQSTDEEDGCDGVTREGSAMDVDLSQPEPARTSRSSRVRDMPLPPPLARPASVADIRSTGHNLFSPSASHDRGPRTRDPSLVKAVTTMSRSEQPFMQRETPPSHPASTNKTASSSRRFSTSSQSQPQDWSKGKQRATEPTLVGHANVTSNEDNEDSEDNMAVDEPEAPREHVLSKSDSTKIPPMQKWPHIQAMPTADKRNLTKAPASTSSRPFYHPVRDPSPVKFSTASLRGVHSPAEPSRPSPSPIQTQTTASSASYRPACTPSSQYASGPRALGMLGVRGRSSRLHQPFKAPRPSQASQQTLQRDVPTHMFSEPTRTQSRIAGVLTTTSGPSRTASAESSWGETPFSNTGSSITNSGKRVSSAPASGLFASEPPVSEVEDDGAVSEGYSREEHYSYSHEKRNDEDVSRQARPPQAPVSRRSLSPEATLEADSSYGDIMPEFDLQTINMIMQPYDCVKA